MLYFVTILISAKIVYNKYKHKKEVRLWTLNTFKGYTILLILT